MLSSWWRSQTEQRLKKRVLARWRVHEEVAARVDHVLKLHVDFPAGAGDPRGLPGNPEFAASGWTDHMLLRYCLAMDHAVGKSVLDTCCGLGWGSYLVGAVARSVVGIDLDEGAVAFCRETWREDNLEFLPGSVLELPFPANEFDVVLCMEALEHFTVEDGRRYLTELHRVCRPGGILLGSSAFPENKTDADALCALNEHHLHIYTRDEMHTLLSAIFSPPLRLTRHYFAARKP
ncbi:MAG TPA: class I SAM-dependent methyltransferase [Polyangiaceae bacterium]|nr:class I SAM-dependent methyltransferase [Polyangiaceae bacterium]